MTQLISRGGLDKSLESNSFVMQNLKVKVLPSLVTNMRVQACLAGNYCITASFFMLSLSPQMLALVNHKVKGREDEKKKKAFSGAAIVD